MKEYPIIEGDVITILDDYSNAATGRELRLDFGDIAVDNIKEEAKDCICRKYAARSASPTYLRVLVPAVRRFALFAKERGIDSFAAYDSTVPQEYLTYLGHLGEEDGRGYSAKYIRYLWSVPMMIKNAMVQ